MSLGGELLHDDAFALGASTRQPDFHLLHQLLFAAFENIFLRGKFRQREFLLGKAFDVAQAAALTRREERDGDARLAGASRPPDAVDVDFGIVG